MPPTGTVLAGTGLSPSYIPPESLRLEFTYRRRRKTGEPEWETLTRGGSDTAETVVLDVP